MDQELVPLNRFVIHGRDYEEVAFDLYRSDQKTTVKILAPLDECEAKTRHVHATGDIRVESICTDASFNKFMDFMVAVISGAKAISGPRVRRRGR